MGDNSFSAFITDSEASPTRLSKKPPWVGEPWVAGRAPHGGQCRGSRLNKHIGRPRGSNRARTDPNSVALTVEPASLVYDKKCSHFAKKPVPIWGLKVAKFLPNGRLAK